MSRKKRRPPSKRRRPLKTSELELVRRTIPNVRDVVAIKDAPGYFITDDGRVISLRQRRVGARVRRPTPTKDGYLQMQLSVRGVAKPNLPPDDGVLVVGEILRGVRPEPAQSRETQRSDRVEHLLVASFTFFLWGGVCVRLEPLEEGLGERDLRKQHEGLFSLPQAFGDRFEIDFRLAGAGDAVEQDGIEALTDR